MLNSDVAKEFIFDCRMRKLSEKTIRGYQTNLDRMFRYIERESNITDLEDTDVGAIVDYLHYLTSLNRKESYINGLIKSFRAYFKYCYNERYITMNPMNKVKFQKMPETLINTFTDAEVRKMIAYYKGTRFLDLRNQLIMLLLFDTGIRNSELCGLEMDRLRDRYFTIVGKGNKERALPISPAINKTLIKYLRVRENYLRDKRNYEVQYLLFSQNGRKLTVEAIEHIVKTCGDGCHVRKSIRVSPHTCRHYYAQAQLKNGCDLYTLSRLLGHSNINITKTYLQSMTDETVLDIGIKNSPLMNLHR